MFYPQHAQASTGTRPPLASQPHLGGGVVLEQAAGADILPDHGQALVAGLGHDRPLTHSSCHVSKSMSISMRRAVRASLLWMPHGMPRLFCRRVPMRSLAFSPNLLPNGYSTHPSFAL